MTNLIEKIWSLRQEWASERGITDEQSSVLMGYDFHTHSENPALIEINTNAAFALGSSLLYQKSGHESIAKNFKKVLLKSFQQEWAFVFPDKQKPMGIAIVDENAKTQKLYPEFLMFKDFFQAEWGVNTFVGSPEDFIWKSGIFSHRESGARVDLVYNRLTDFYLEASASSALKEAYEDRSICLTPNPREYDLLSNKARLVELSGRGLIADAQYLSKWDADDLWKQRKKYFFKPQNSFGSKGTYRGEKISLKKFQELLKDPKNYIVQSYHVAPHVEWEKQIYKYDLRCYVYRDQIQGFAARLYTGQVTGLDSEGGGFAPVEIL